MTRYVVIGGGIIGNAVARELALRKVGDVVVLEKEPVFGRHASGRNSGVIHSGINQKPGSLKATMCVEGSRRLRDYCRKRGVPMVECGTLVVARNAREASVLERLMFLGRECGVPDLHIIDSKELRDREPLVEAQAALLSPSGATVDSIRLVEAVAEEAKELGVRHHMDCRVLRIHGGEIESSQGIIRADHIINCAGLYADHIAHQMGAGNGYCIIPFRGEYMLVKDCAVRTMVYQPPDLRFPFLSIHLTRETDGRVLAGPSAVLALGREAYEKQWIWRDCAAMALSPRFWRMVFKPSFMGLALENAKTSFSKQAFYRQVRALVPSIQPEQLEPARAGIRAQMVDAQGRMVDDIVVEYRKDSTHVLNAVSPGMTCSLAFAEHLADNITR